MYEISKSNSLKVQFKCVIIKLEGNPTMFKRKCKITFITHGATVHSLDGIMSDSEKYPKLNDFGEEEIKKVCEYLETRAVAYDKIYTSSSTRCTQSAQIIAKLFKNKFITINLPPRKLGEWSGHSYTDIYDTYGAKAILQTPDGGEALKDFNKRVKSVIQDLVKENRGNRIIIVTTPDVVQSAVAQTLGLKGENQFKVLIKTGSLTQISYFEDNWSSLIYSDYMPL
ncbi:histidine phosphatase family protein [bacterium]|nr:histidine phosphatase family protein [bacterium]